MTKFETQPNSSPPTFTKGAMAELPASDTRVERTPEEICALGAELAAVQSRQYPDFTEQDCERVAKMIVSGQIIPGGTSDH